MKNQNPPKRAGFVPGVKKSISRYLKMIVGIRLNTRMMKGLKKYERRISSLENEMLAAVKRKDYVASNRLSKEIMGLEREYRKIMNAK